MYAKVFAQIYDGTLCTKGPWEALVTFQQMLVLADQEGNVDMTAAAISRRTTIPLEIIERGIAELLKPDPESRTPTEQGRRLLPLSEGRTWGWRVVNYMHYRALKREDDRREYHREYWHKRKEKPGEIEKIKARAKLNNAIRDGFVTRPDGCDLCSAPSPEAHHDDYEQPYAVRWLCKRCHEQHHHNSTTIPQHAQPNQPIAEAEAKAEAKTRKKAKPSIASLRNVPAELVDEWSAVRKAKRGTAPTDLAVAAVQREADVAGLTLEQAIRVCCERSWITFKADWYAEKQGKQTSETAYQRGMREQMGQWAPGIARKSPVAQPFTLDLEEVTNVPAIGSR